MKVKYDYLRYDTDRLQEHLLVSPGTLKGLSLQDGYIAIILLPHPDSKDHAH